MRCPKCSLPTLAGHPEAGSPARLVRCEACGTTWLARHHAVGLHGPQGLREPPPLTPRQPSIIEGELAGHRPAARPPPAPSFARPLKPPPAPRRRRYGLTAAAGVAVALLVAVILFAPAVYAFPGLADALFGHDGLTLSGVTSRTVELRGTEAIFVEGEIVNRSQEASDVPAVRISLQSSGEEVYSWLVEPTVLTVPAGATIGFRAAFASPAPGTGEIAATFAERSRAASEKD